MYKLVVMGQIGDYYKNREYTLYEVYVSDPCFKTNIKYRYPSKAIVN